MIDKRTFLTNSSSIYKPQEINSDEDLIKELTSLLELTSAHLPDDDPFRKDFGKRIDHAINIARGKR